MLQDNDKLERLLKFVVFVAGWSYIWTKYWAFASSFTWKVMMLQDSTWLFSTWSPRWLVLNLLFTIFWFHFMVMYRVSDSCISKPGLNIIEMWCAFPPSPLLFWKTSFCTNLSQWSAYHISRFDLYLVCDQVLWGSMRLLSLAKIAVVQCNLNIVTLLSKFVCNIVVKNNNKLTVNFLPR